MMMTAKDEEETSEAESRWSGVGRLQIENGIAQGLMYAQNPRSELYQMAIRHSMIRKALPN